MDQYPDKSFPPAVSASPNIVTHALNKSGKLEEKTSVVVFNFQKDEFDVYRRSKTIGMWSREIYQISTKKRTKKDKLKYAKPPLVPSGAHTCRIQDIEFSAMVKMDESFLEDIVKLIKMN